MPRNTTTPAELAQQIVLRQQRFAKVTQEIRELLRDDIPNWVQRQAREAFLARPAIAKQLGKERVKELKMRAANAATSAATTLFETLGEQALWTRGPATTDAPRTLNDAEGVRDAIAAVGAALSDLLAGYDLRPKEAPTYEPPVYFVSGRYFPALAEHYWKLRGEIAELSEEKVATEEALERSNLEALWDEA